MIIKKKNLQKIITNNIIQQTPPNSSDRNNLSIDPETTIPLAEWLNNIHNNKPPPKITPRNLTIIYSLNLSNSSLVSFPQEIIQLSSLKFLILDENSISIIPKNITSLKNLEMLSISHNRLGYLDSWLKKLTNLTYLNLSKNNIMTLTEDLRFLKNLETLLIQENSFEELPIYFSEMINLKELGLDWFLFLIPSIEKTVIQRDIDPIFNKLMFSLRNKTKELKFEYFLSEFSQPNSSKIQPFEKLLTKQNIFKCGTHNNLGVIRAILNKTPNLMSEINEKGFCLFSQAVLNKNPFIPDILLQLNFELSKGFGKYNSPLNLAISVLEIELTIKLLKLGHSPNILDHEGNNSLHLLFNGRFSQIPLQKAKEISHLLLEAGVQPNYENKAKLTAIHEAIKSNQYHAIEWALNYNKRKRAKKDSKALLFDFDKKFGAFYFTAAHYAIFLGKGPIIELMSNYPDEVDFFDKCKTGKSPKQVAYKNLALIKLCFKCERNWLNSKVLNGLLQKTNINLLPEGIVVNQRVDPKILINKRPKSRSEFHKKSLSTFFPSSEEKKIQEKLDLDEFEESPNNIGSKNILSVKTKEKAQNNISFIDHKHQMTDNIDLDENLKVQNKILLKIQYKTIEINTIQALFENLICIIMNPELVFSEKIKSLLYARLFQYKLNFCVEKFYSAILPYSVFLINTFFNSPVNIALFKKRACTLQKYLVTFADIILKETLTEKSQNLDGISINLRMQHQLLFNEIIRTCLSNPQITHEDGFSFQKFYKKGNISINNYEIFHANKNLLFLSKKQKTSDKFSPVKFFPEKIIKKPESPQIKTNSPGLKKLYCDNNQVCVGDTKKLMGGNDEEMMIIETARRSSLKAYYFPSKQDFSPFQTKEKGGLKI